MTTPEKTAKTSGSTGIGPAKDLETRPDRRSMRRRRQPVGGERGFMKDAGQVTLTIITARLAVRGVLVALAWIL
jgi:hypothetical protein